jgi:hypothetical protein
MLWTQTPQASLRSGELIHSKSCVFNGYAHVAEWLTMNGSDNQRVPIAIGATTNERRQSRDAAITGALGPSILARNYISNHEHGIGEPAARSSGQNDRAVPNTTVPHGSDIPVRASPPQDQREDDKLEPHDSHQPKPRGSTHEHQIGRDVVLGTGVLGTGTVAYEHHKHNEQYGDDFAPSKQQGDANLADTSGYIRQTGPSGTAVLGTSDTRHQPTTENRRQTETDKDEHHHHRLLGFLHRDKEKKHGKEGAGSSAKQYHQSEPKATVTTVAGNTDAGIEMERNHEKQKRQESKITEAGSTNTAGSDRSNHSVGKPAEAHQTALDEVKRQQKEPGKEEKNHHRLLGILHRDKSNKGGEEREKEANSEATAATASITPPSEAAPGPTDQKLSGHKRSVRNKLTKEPPPNRYIHVPASDALTAPFSNPDEQPHHDTSSNPQEKIQEEDMRG